MQKLANNIYAGLPARTKMLVTESRFVGGQVISLEDQTGWAVRVGDLKAHHAFLRPLVKEFPSTVPSGFLCADVLLELNRMFDDKLFVPIEDDTKDEMALANGGKLKKMVGALRNLYRHAKAGKDDIISELKGYLMPSPKGKKDTIAVVV